MRNYVYYKKKIKSKEIFEADYNRSLRWRLHFGATCECIREASRSATLIKLRPVKVASNGSLGKAPIYEPVALPIC